jgi:hypothetical protein
MEMPIAGFISTIFRLVNSYNSADLRMDYILIYNIYIYIHTHTHIYNIYILYIDICEDHDEVPSGNPTCLADKRIGG